MMRRIFAGRTMLFFCCLAGLAWASWGLLSSQSSVVSASDDLLTDIRVSGTEGYHMCWLPRNCPGSCVKERLIRWPNGNPFIIRPVL